MREVAGPNLRASFAEAQVYLHADLLTLQMFGNRGLVVIGERLTLARSPDPAEADRKPVAVRGLPCLAHGHHDAAPVGVFPSNGGFDQWRIGDGETKFAGALVIDGTGDPELVVAMTRGYPPGAATVFAVEGAWGNLRPAGARIIAFRG